MVAQDTRVPGWLLEVRTREITSRSHAVIVAGSPGKNVEHDPSPKTSAVSEIRPRETTSRCSRTVPVAGSSKEAVEHGRTVLPKHSSTVGVPPRSRAVSVADSSKEAAEHGRTVLPIHSGTVRCVGGETSWDNPPPRSRAVPGLFESQDSRVWPNRSPKTLEHRALCRRWDFVRQPLRVLALPLSRCLWCMRSSLTCVRLATTHSRVGISFPDGFPTKMKRFSFVSGVCGA